jgi:rhamnogalacturonyl hydrolase YesR
MKRELLILQPRTRIEKWDSAYYKLLAHLVLEGVDFEFDGQSQVPCELPEELGDYRNILLFTEDLPYNLARLKPAFGDVDAFAQARLRDGNNFRFLLSKDGKTRLFVKSLLAYLNTGVLSEFYWAAGLTMGSPHFCARQLARSEDLVINQALNRVEATPADMDMNLAQAPFCSLRAIMGAGTVPWSEFSGILQRCLIDLGNLTGRKRLTELAVGSVHRYLKETDPQEVPVHGDYWSLVESVQALHEITQEDELLQFIRLRLAQRQSSWKLWRGMFGLWPDDRWIRDSNFACMIVPAVRAAKYSDDPAAIYDQAVYQARTTEELLRDADTGLYHFGSDGTRRTPGLLGHGSYWHMFAFSQLLTWLPRAHPGYSEVSKIFRRLASALAGLQGESGLWHQHLDRPETSTADAVYSGGIVGALYRGLYLGVLGKEKFEPVARRGFDGLKLRNFDGLSAGGAAATTISPAPRYYTDKYTWDALHYGDWQQLFPFVEYLRYRASLPS